MTLPFLRPPSAESGAAAPSAFRYRGLYVESKWGPDLMALDDWRHLLDEMVFLQMNSLGVGVYGCWVVQYEGRRSEFLMVPFPDHPRLQTAKTICWYSPAAGTRAAARMPLPGVSGAAVAPEAEQTLTYLPRMFEQDFFGQVVAYGKEKGIAVRPHFNGPGHSTLVPSVYPEVSSLDEQGQPTGFGYCLTSERTYDLLFSLYDSLIARHLRPHGGEWWHMGLDEVDTYAGIDESDPGRVVDPWCKCPNCAARPKSELLVDFALRSIAHLVDQGIRHVTLWHDALLKLQGYPLFKEALAARGLTERVAVQWWRYGTPPLAVQERSLRSWVTPMAGYWSNLFHHDYGPNIRAMVNQGAEAGSEGLDAYCIYDPAYLQSYACLASLGQDPSLDLAAFEADFGQWLFEGMPLPPAFAHARLLFDSSYGPLGSLLDALLRYWWTYPAQRHVRYPRDQVAQLAADPLRAGRALATAQSQAEHLRAACADAAPRAADARRRRLLEEYACEAGKLAGIIGAFRQAAAGWNFYHGARQAAGREGTQPQTGEKLARAEKAFGAAHEAVLGVMAELERVKVPYLRPHILRDLTPLYRWCADTHDQMQAFRTEFAAGTLDALPPL